MNIVGPEESQIYGDLGTPAGAGAGAGGAGAGGAGAVLSTFFHEHAKQVPSSIKFLNLTYQTL